MLPFLVSQPVPKNINSGPDSVLGERAFVTKVLDGDTIEVLINGEQKIVRLLGVDAPETVDPRKPVQCFGKEASNKIKKLLYRKSIILKKDITEKDKYGRLLRFIFLPLENRPTSPDIGDAFQGEQLLFVNDYLIREGFAKVLNILPDLKYSQKFFEAQREAREAKKGLWGICP